MARYIDADKLKDTIKANDHIVFDTVDIPHRGMFTSSILQAIDEIPERNPPTFVYGYPIEYLAVFAATCQEAGVEPNEMRELYDNIEYLSRIINTSMERSMQQAIKNFTENMAEGATQ